MHFLANATPLLAALKLARKAIGAAGDVGIRVDDTGAWVMGVAIENGFARQIETKEVEKNGECRIDHRRGSRHRNNGKTDAEALADLLAEHRDCVLRFRLLLASTVNTLSHLHIYTTGDAATLIGTIAVDASYYGAPPALPSTEAVAISAEPRPFWKAVDRALVAIEWSHNQAMECINIVADENGFSRWYSCDGYTLLRQRVAIEATFAGGLLLLHRDLLTRAQKALKKVDRIQVARFEGPREGVAIFDAARATICWRYFNNTHPLQYPDLEEKFVARWSRGYATRLRIDPAPLVDLIIEAAGRAKADRGAFVDLYFAAPSGQLGAIVTNRNAGADAIYASGVFRASSPSLYVGDQDVTTVDPARLAPLLAVFDRREELTVAVTPWHIGKTMFGTKYFQSGTLALEQSDLLAFLMPMNEPERSIGMHDELEAIQMEQSK